MKMDELMGNPVSVKVTKVVTETPQSKTLYFSMSKAIESHPGQFVMVWVPGVDEVPMSVSAWNPPEMGVTVRSIGEATESLVSMKKGDWIGIRGPFGNPFSVNCRSALVVGGGVGIAPLRPLVYALLNRRAEITLVNAAKTKDELIFLKEFIQNENSNLSVKIATDDGSLGFKGFATDLVKTILDEQEFDRLYTCGPEVMMAGLYNQALKKKIGFQASLERFMKCGCGVCGTCAVDPTGQLVCKEGPVFTGTQLTNLTDFGKYHRNAVGMKKEC